ncbi:MAG: hypothetical protein CVU12_06675 [Bacteroidetes bacterium HGW-Bacteroidetes-7]|jgi:nitrate reductase gamma subunit|nr:MAG: hypothetical protein CVU12_06675 [Bacteroidetes bacterium HGW-Bacteroidetes-7]
MEWYQILAVISAFLCITLLTTKLVNLIKLGLPKELSQPSGSVKDGIVYSFTGAMSPKAKESAYMHMPTYFAGIVYHIGTFTSLFMFPVILLLSDILESLPQIIIYLVAGGLAISAISGAGILIKRLITDKLRYFSSADDYISNFLTTAIQAVTALIIISAIPPVLYYITAAAFFIWLPLGKTKHLLYFFFARIHLGYFYGRRGTWPVSKKN